MFRYVDRLMSKIWLPDNWCPVLIDNFGSSGCASKSKVNGQDYFATHINGVYNDIVQVLISAWCRPCVLTANNGATWVPYSVNSICFVCQKCTRAVVRIEGYVTEKWYMEIPVW